MLFRLLLKAQIREGSFRERSTKLEKLKKTSEGYDFLSKTIVRSRLCRAASQNPLFWLNPKTQICEGIKIKILTFPRAITFWSWGASSRMGQIWVNTDDNVVK